MTTTMPPEQPPEQPPDTPARSVAPDVVVGREVVGPEVVGPEVVGPDVVKPDVVEPDVPTPATSGQAPTPAPTPSTPTPTATPTATPATTPTATPAVSTTPAHTITPTTPAPTTTTTTPAPRQELAPPASWNSGKITRVAANEETTLLTPVSDGTSATDRIPLTHKARWIALTSVLAILLLVAAGFAAYLWDVSRAWEAQVAEIDSANQDLGERLATEQSEVVRQQAQLDLLTEQLRTAQARITELADINAQAGDNVQYYVQEINRINELTSTAAAVATALTRCVEGHEQLAIYLRDEENYDPAELAAYEASLATLCSNAKSANSQLQQAMSQ